ncbi:hypothetical protein DCCM_4505 [Desulfocucumis palustris]|uniref:DUF1634 domain-containing protein n=1 Tax=Desulfocucumis palustris TaxID=1898651 RepID=A0A2L2XGX5_9FIRM|nr:DUF1634 domain-containing protein [Desulfocucumis palustris]GBF35382.1 hypothetical protein DCCM_4505 [Desulfocucumis palustris]
MSKANINVAEHGPVKKAEDKKQVQKIEIPQEQIKYANLLLYGAWTGIAILLVTFTLYMGGILKAFVPPSQMPQYWTMKVGDYLHATGAPTGWSWLGMLGYGDIVNFIGVALLGLLTIGGYLILLPAYLKKKDTPYTAIVIAELIVLTVAASGILGVSAGH